MFAFVSYLAAATLRGEINNGRFAMPLGRGRTRTLLNPCSLGVQDLDGCTSESRVSLEIPMLLVGQDAS